MELVGKFKALDGVMLLADLRNVTEGRESGTEDNIHKLMDKAIILEKEYGYIRDKDIAIVQLQITCEVLGVNYIMYEGIIDSYRLQHKDALLLAYLVKLGEYDLKEGVYIISEEQKQDEVAYITSKGRMIVGNLVYNSVEEACVCRGWRKTEVEKRLLKGEELKTILEDEARVAKEINTENQGKLRDYTVFEDLNNKKYIGLRNMCVELKLNQKRILSLWRANTGVHWKTKLFEFYTFETSNMRGALKYQLYKYTSKLGNEYKDILEYLNIFGLRHSYNSIKEWTNKGCSLDASIMYTLKKNKNFDQMQDKLYNCMEKWYVDLFLEKEKQKEEKIAKETEKKSKYRKSNKKAETGEERLKRLNKLTAYAENSTEEARKSIRMSAEEKKKRLPVEIRDKIQNFSRMSFVQSAEYPVPGFYGEYYPDLSDLTRAYGVPTDKARRMFNNRKELTPAETVAEIMKVMNGISNIQATSVPIQTADEHIQTANVNIESEIDTHEKVENTIMSNQKRENIRKAKEKNKLSKITTKWPEEKKRSMLTGEYVQYVEISDKMAMSKSNDYNFDGICGSDFYTSLRELKLSYGVGTERFTDLLDKMEITAEDYAEYPNINFSEQKQMAVNLKIQKALKIWLAENGITALARSISANTNTRVLTEEESKKLEEIQKSIYIQFVVRTDESMPVKLGSYVFMGPCGEWYKSIRAMARAYDMVDRYNSIYYTSNNDSSLFGYTLSLELDIKLRGKGVYVVNMYPREVKETTIDSKVGQEFVNKVVQSATEDQAKTDKLLQDLEEKREIREDSDWEDMGNTTEEIKQAEITKWILEDKEFDTLEEACEYYGDVNVVIVRDLLEEHKEHGLLLDSIMEMAQGRALKRMKNLKTSESELSGIKNDIDEMVENIQKEITNDLTSIQQDIQDNNILSTGTSVLKKWKQRVKTLSKVCTDIIQIIEQVQT